MSLKTPTRAKADAFLEILHADPSIASAWGVSVRDFAVALKTALALSRTVLGMPKITMPELLELTQACLIYHQSRFPENEDAPIATFSEDEVAESAEAHPDEAKELDAPAPALDDSAVIPRHVLEAIEAELPVAAKGDHPSHSVRLLMPHDVTSKNRLVQIGGTCADATCPFHKVLQSTPEKLRENLQALIEYLILISSPDEDLFHIRTLLNDPTVQLRKHPQGILLEVPNYNYN